MMQQQRRRFIALAAFFLVPVTLTACNDRLTLSDLMDSAQASFSEQGTFVNQSSVRTEAQIYDFQNKYALGQSTQAIYSRLGSPTWRTSNTDTWRVQKMGIDGRPTGTYASFRVNYDRNGNAQTWNTDW